MFRSAILVLALVAAILFVVAFQISAFAQAATLPASTIVSFSYGDFVNQVLEAVRNATITVVVALAAYAARSLPGVAADFIKMAIANRWLDRAVDFAFNTTEGALKGRTVSVDVGTALVANGAAYIMAHAPAWLISWLGGHVDDIKDRILARIPTDQGASLAATAGGTVAYSVVQPTGPIG